MADEVQKVQVVEKERKVSLLQVIKPTEVTTEGETVVAGVGVDGRQFVARKAVLFKPIEVITNETGTAADDALPFKVFTRKTGYQGAPYIVLNPSFEDAEAWLNGDGEQVIEFTLSKRAGSCPNTGTAKYAAGRLIPLDRDKVLALLGPKPQEAKPSYVVFDPEADADE